MNDASVNVAIVGQTTSSISSSVSIPFASSGSNVNLQVTYLVTFPYMFSNSSDIAARYNIFLGRLETSVENQQFTTLLRQKSDQYGGAFGSAVSQTLPTTVLVTKAEPQYTPTSSPVDSKTSSLSSQGTSSALVPAVVASVVVIVAMLALAYFFLVVRRRRESAGSSTVDGKVLFDEKYYDDSKYSHSGGIELEVRNTKIYDDHLKFEGQNYAAFLNNYVDATAVSPRSDNPMFKLKTINSNNNGDAIVGSNEFLFELPDQLNVMNNPGFGKVKSPKMKVDKVLVEEFDSENGSNSNGQASTPVIAETFVVTDSWSETYKSMVNPAHKQANRNTAVVDSEEQTSNLSATFQSKYLAYGNDDYSDVRSTTATAAAKGSVSLSP